jgi:hypothetical protein
MFLFKRKNLKNQSLKEETITQASVGDQAQCLESPQAGKNSLFILRELPHS